MNLLVHDLVEDECRGKPSSLSGVKILASFTDLENNMKAGTIFGAFLAGSFFAAATLEEIYHPEISDIRIIDWPFFCLTLPGLIVACVISGDINIHKTSVVATANFMFYFGVAWLLGRWWEKHRSLSQSASYPHRRGRRC